MTTSSLNTASYTIGVPQYQVGSKIQYGKKSYTIKRRLYDYDADSYFYICQRVGDRQMIEESQIVLEGQSINKLAG